MKRVKHVRADDGTHWGYSFFCPGCKDTHAIPTKPFERGWDFNGDEEKPTFTPSILVHPHTTLAEDGTVCRTPNCHTLVREGRIEFLADCSHALAGTTVDLPPVAEDQASPQKVS